MRKKIELSAQVKLTLQAMSPAEQAEILGALEKIVSGELKGEPVDLNSLSAEEREQIERASAELKHKGPSSIS
jgi:hypothetical protein